jgi:RNA-directed DNA polymerase
VHASNRQQHHQTSRQLQRTLYRAAKRSRERRFHALHDRMYRPDVLWRAWQEVRANDGEAGIDGQTIGDIEKAGVPEFLNGLAEDLKARRYHPKPVRRVWIPKPDGRKRPLGIPTVRDRVAQQACRIVVEPAFEATFEDCSYGFRPKRSAQQAIRVVKEALIRGWQVVDADIQGYFDNIDHDLLLSLVKRRISDRGILKLMRQWLKAGVVEQGEYQRTEKGTPQGGVISPLLANIYLHVMDRYWKLECGTLGKLVRYADDFVIICRGKSEAQEAMKRIQAILARLKLTLHPQKTRIVDAGTEGFDFLGFHICKFRNSKSGKLLPYVRPSAKAMERIRQRLRELTQSRWLHVTLHETVRQLNEVIRGWRQYFGWGNGTRQFQAMDHYLRSRLWRYYRRRAGGNAKWMAMVRRFQRWILHCGIEPFYQTGIFGTAT